MFILNAISIINGTIISISIIIAIIINILLNNLDISLSGLSLSLINGSQNPYPRSGYRSDKQ